MKYYPISSSSVIIFSWSIINSTTSDRDTEVEPICITTDPDYRAVKKHHDHTVNVNILHRKIFKNERAVGMCDRNRLFIRKSTECQF